MESTRDSKSYLREVKGSVKTLRSGGKKEEEDRRRWSNFSQRLTMGIWAERRAQLESGGNEMTEKPIHSDKERMEQKVAMGGESIGGGITNSARIARRICRV